MRGTAVGGLAVGLDLQPEGAAVADFDEMRLRGLGDDAVACLHQALVSQPTHPSHAAAFLVRGEGERQITGDLKAEVMKGAQDPDDAGDPAFHVRNSQAIKFAVLDHGLPGVFRPPLAGWDGIEVAAEVHPLVAALALTIASQEIHPWIAFAPWITLLGFFLGDIHQLDVTIERPDEIAAKRTKSIVILAWWIHRRNVHQFDQVPDQGISHVIDASQQVCAYRHRMSPL